jgi:tripartite-type tricarboxylate transporter receptor subunit TctC
MPPRKVATRAGAATARAEVAAAMNHPSLKERLAALSIEPPTMSPAQFQAYVGNEVKRWNKVARDANIRVEE